MEAVASSSNYNNKDSDRSSMADVICEFLEVSFNLILYVRSVYPNGIFRKSRKYNVAVMMSRHPELNKYICDVLTGINALISAGNVERVTFQINTKEDEPIERFVFELRLFEGSENSERTLNRVCEIEQCLRDLLLKINNCDAVLQPLPEDCTFSVNVQTKESVANELMKNDHFEGFPWIRAESSDNTTSLQKSSIHPLKSCNMQNLKIQCFVERVEVK